MKKYIEINDSSEIIDVFFEYQTSKMNSPSKIFLENTNVKKHYINNTSISNGNGVYLYRYINSIIQTKTDEDIELDPLEIKGKRDIIIDQLSVEDSKLQRGTEDLIGVLIDKGLILDTDLGDQLKNRYYKKKTLRDKL